MGHGFSRMSKDKSRGSPGTQCYKLKPAALFCKPRASSRPRIKCGINSSRNPVFPTPPLAPGYPRGDSVCKEIFLKLTALGLIIVIIA